MSRTYAPGQRAAIYLDPQLIIHTDQPTAPILDEFIKETVQKGSDMILDLLQFLREQDAKVHETPDDTHAFPVIKEGILVKDVCPHNVPRAATCTWCLEGIASTTTEDITQNVRIISPTWNKKTTSKVYNLSRWQRISLYVRTWLKEPR